MYDSDLFPEPALTLEVGAGPVFRIGAREQLRPPKELQERLTRAGGLNRFGKPNFVLRWGWEPTNYVYSRRARCYEMRPRYARRNRWYVEQWFPPEFYGTPRTWRRTFTENIDGREIDTLGPFPTFGAYEQLLTIATPHSPECLTPREYECACGGSWFTNLTPSMVDALVDRVRASRHVNAWDRKYSHQRTVEKQEQDFDNLAEDMIRDKQPVFDLSPTVFLGHKNTLPDRWRVKGVS